MRLIVVVDRKLVNQPDIVWRVRNLCEISKNYLWCCNEVFLLLLDETRGGENSWQEGLSRLDLQRVFSRCNIKVSEWVSRVHLCASIVRVGFTRDYGVTRSGYPVRWQIRSNTYSKSTTRFLFFCYSIPRSDIYLTVLRANSILKWRANFKKQ